MVVLILFRFWLAILENSCNYGFSGINIQNMPVALSDIVLTYIDETLDINDLENPGDVVRSAIVVENIEEWQLKDGLRQRHIDLKENFQNETNKARRLRLKVAINHYEADFWDYFVAVETFGHWFNFKLKRP